MKRRAALAEVAESEDTDVVANPEDSDPEPPHYARPWRDDDILNDAATAHTPQLPKMPERELALAILIEAVLNIRTGRGPNNYQCKKARRDALQWMRATRDPHHFSFERVCEVLGINDDWFRAKIEREERDLLVARRTPQLRSVR